MVEGPRGIAVEYECVFWQCSGRAACDAKQQGQQRNLAAISDDAELGLMALMATGERDPKLCCSPFCFRAWRLGSSGYHNAT